MEPKKTGLSVAAGKKYAKENLGKTFTIRWTKMRNKSIEKQASIGCMDAFLKKGLTVSRKPLTQH